MRSRHEKTGTGTGLGYSGHNRQLGQLPGLLPGASILRGQRVGVVAASSVEGVSAVGRHRGWGRNCGRNVRHFRKKKKRGGEKK
jgi:hypothetical protein